MCIDYCKVSILILQKIGFYLFLKDKTLLEYVSNEAQ